MSEGFAAHFSVLAIISVFPFGPIVAVCSGHLCHPRTTCRLFACDTLPTKAQVIIRISVWFMDFRVLDSSGFILIEADNSSMSNDGDREETQDVSVRMPADFIENKLLPAYPAATSVSGAIRMAVQNDIERQREPVTSDVSNDVINAIEEHGGSFESTQRLEIDIVEDMQVSEAENMTVKNNPD